MMMWDTALNFTLEINNAALIFALKMGAALFSEG
jgi:hypothetical protein